MNALIKIIVTFTLIIGFSYPAMANDADGTTSGGTAISIGTGTNTLDFTPSGNTILQFNTTPTAYTIGAASKKTDEKNGIEYAMVSDKNGYYQHAQTDEGAITTATAAGTAPDWTYMGGGS